MARVFERSALTQKERIQWLERDMDDVEVNAIKEFADVRADLVRIEGKADRITSILIAVLITTTSSAIFFGLSLLTGK